MLFKPSMFNRVLNSGSSLILYNSFGGTRSLLRIETNKVGKVIRWLNDNHVDETEDLDFTRLVKLGYLVPESTDEKKLRMLHYLNHISNNRLQLVIHVTQECNFRCAYCYMDFKPVMLSQDTQEGIINYIKKNIQKYKAVQVSWFGGEPTLGMKIIENLSRKIIDICKIHKRPYTAIITTNGYNLNPENVNILLACHVTHIAVTIDGNAKLHDSQRTLADGSPTFDHIIRNLINIRDNIKTQTLTVSIRINITEKHLSYIEEFYNYYNDIFGNDHRFSLFVRPVADYGGTRVKSMKKFFVNDMHGVYDSLLKIQSGIKFFPNFIDLEIGGYTCSAHQLHKYTIGCDGSISKCDESLNIPIGFLTSDGTMEIDPFKHAEWIFGSPKKQCDECFFSGSCFMELCPKARIQGNWNVCPVNFNDIDSLILLAANTYNIDVL